MADWRSPTEREFRPASRLEIDIYPPERIICEVIEKASINATSIRSAETRRRTIGIQPEAYLLLAEQAVQSIEAFGIARPAMETGDVLIEQKFNFFIGRIKFPEHTLDEGNLIGADLPDN